MREVILPSGAKLKIQPAPFAAAKALYQAVLAEFRNIPVSVDMDMAGLFKNLFCAGFSSPVIEAALNKCLERCTYNTGAGDFKIDDQSFEPVERRQDYIVVCKEVVQDNAGPFAKSLFADYRQFLSMTGSILESQPKTTN